jgi:hypothetical protein
VSTVPDPGTSVVILQQHGRILSSTLPFEDPSRDDQDLPQCQVKPSELSRLNDDHGTQVITNDSIPSGNPIDGLGSRLSSSADDLFERDHGNNPVLIPSKPTRLGSRLSSSAADLFENDHGTNPGSAVDPIEQSATKLEMGRLRGSDAFHDKGIGTTPGEQIKKISRFPALADDRFADAVGISPVSISSEPSGFGSHLSSSNDDSHELAFFGLDDEHGIHVITEDSIQIESYRLGSQISSLDGNLFKHDHGITPVSVPSAVVAADSIPSEPPDGLGSPLTSSAVDLFERDAFHDEGIGTTPGEQIKKMAVDLFGRDTFHDEGIGTTPGEQIKKMISRSSCVCVQEARPDSICSVRRGVTRFPYVDDVISIRG